ncbi:MAG TPA: cyclic nucleotide-binding domain-containing protein [Chromatiaceae bacterium]|nr:cyclic nucleotide-binding domain-containing protein [Chromatiaceae bacterium]
MTADWFAGIGQPRETVVKETIREILADAEFAEGTAWRRHHLHPNQVIVREGEKGRSLFYIERGKLRVTGRVQLDSERHVQPGICDMGAGEVFGELSLYGCRTRTATVTALSEAVVVELDGEQLAQFLHANPELGYRMLRALFETLADRLSRADRQMENLLAWGLKAHAIEKHL